MSDVICPLPCFVEISCDPIFYRSYESESVPKNNLIVCWEDTEIVIKESVLIALLGDNATVLVLNVQVVINGVQ
jgi:hypothetical protein